MAPGWPYPRPGRVRSVKPLFADSRAKLAVAGCFVQRGACALPVHPLAHNGLLLGTHLQLWFLPTPPHPHGSLISFLPPPNYCLLVPSLEGSMQLRQLLL